jgi:hypothetical protein
MPAIGRHNKRSRNAVKVIAFLMTSSYWLYGYWFRVEGTKGSRFSVQGSKFWIKGFKTDSVIP